MFNISVLVVMNGDTVATVGNALAIKKNSEIFLINQRRSGFGMTKNVHRKNVFLMFFFFIAWCFFFLVFAFRHFSLYKETKIIVFKYTQIACFHAFSALYQSLCKMPKNGKPFSAMASPSHGQHMRLVIFHPEFSNKRHNELIYIAL